MAGDMNGDGYGDAARAPSGSLVHLHLGGPTGLENAASVLLRVPDGNVVSSVAGVGDIDGDGYADLATAAEVLVAGTGVPRVLVHRGGPTVADLPSQSIDPVGGARLVQAGGDVNGDGYADVLASNCTNPRCSRRVWLYLGSASGLEPTPAWSYESPDDHLTHTGGGDFDGDGYSDVVISSSEGTMLFPGGPSGLPTTSARLLSVSFRESLAFVGDVDSDGFDDVVMGDHLANRWSSVAGQPLVPGWRSVGSGQSGANDHYGQVIVAGGDIDGDGYDDVLVAAPIAAGTNSAYVRLLQGSSTGIGDAAPTGSSWTYTGSSRSSNIGLSMR